MSKDRCQKIFNKHYILSFWITLGVSLSLIVGGFFVPPKGIIDGSVMTSVGLLFLWTTLAALSKAIEDGRVAKLNFGNNSLHIGQDENNNGLDDNWEEENNTSEM